MHIYTLQYKHNAHTLWSINTITRTMACYYTTNAGFMYQLSQFNSHTQDGHSEHDAVLYSRSQSSRRGMCVLVIISLHLSVCDSWHYYSLSSKMVWRHPLTFGGLVTEKEQGSEVDVVHGRFTEGGNSIFRHLLLWAFPNEATRWATSFIIASHMICLDVHVNKI